MWLWAGVAASGLALAENGAAPDATAWLQRASAAARQLNYVGTVVYQHGNQVETSRLIHLHDAAGEHERLTSLDGPMREIVRTNEQVTCYLPESRLARIEYRTARAAFPAFLPQQVSTLAANYNFRKAETARVAGIEAQAYVFEPKDGLRYGHKFWADDASGLLLKARMLNERSEVIEQFMFSDVKVGGRIDRSAVRPSIGTLPPDWKVQKAVEGPDAQQDTGWQVSYVPPGFAKIVEMFRNITGKSAPVAHIVFSDGLVAVSVFVEATAGAPPPVGATQQGAINVYSRLIDANLVTVLGETPGETVQRIANSVSRRP
jgi:sigma-E factor negative regulatory protein RseB